MINGLGATPQMELYVLVEGLKKVSAKQKIHTYLPGFGGKLYDFPGNGRMFRLYAESGRRAEEGCGCPVQHTGIMYLIKNSNTKERRLNMFHITKRNTSGILLKAAGVIRENKDYITELDAERVTEITG